ncbi:hypothetical protein SADUNF_Sadunf13G0107900 [Salix dunnii]|uniref:Uncharacterized protein n=1 Tax=Salix dunnii TaxID=1413687 RepID=A0A835JLV4_9ROSI|nr:hypothetical protein SADUNF_Sadunf13G0107900 [Salix dunnii]
MIEKRLDGYLTSNLIVSELPSENQVWPLENPAPGNSMQLLHGRKRVEGTWPSFSQITDDPFGALSSWNESLHFCEWSETIMNLHFSTKLFSLLPQNYQVSISSTRVLASLLFCTKTPTKPLSSSDSST